jgi:adenine deaminase
MSDQCAEIVAEETNALIAAMQACGCRLNNAYMQHSLLALVVIPELPISDVSLIEVTKFATTDLLVS